MRFISFIQRLSTGSQFKLLNMNEKGLNRFYGGQLFGLQPEIAMQRGK